MFPVAIIHAYVPSNQIPEPLENRTHADWTEPREARVSRVSVGAIHDSKKCQIECSEALWAHPSKPMILSVF
jgi:hypothetical protein